MKGGMAQKKRLQEPWKGHHLKKKSLENKGGWNGVEIQLEVSKGEWVKRFFNTRSENLEDLNKRGLLRSYGMSFFRSEKVGRKNLRSKDRKLSNVGSMVEIQKKNVYTRTKRGNV